MAEESAQISIRLPAAHLARLDQISVAKGVSRAAVVIKMIEKARWSEGGIRDEEKHKWTPADELPEPTLLPPGEGTWTPGHWETAETSPDGCGHPRAHPINGGMLRCPECAMVRGTDDLWRVP